MSAEPELGQLVVEDPIETERAYRVVGIEETSRPGVWRVDFERLDWLAAIAGDDELMEGGY